jgi:hypothetical protein
MISKFLHRSAVSENSPNPYCSGCRASRLQPPSTPAPHFGDRASATHVSHISLSSRPLDNSGRISSPPVYGRESRIEPKNRRVISNGKSHMAVLIKLAKRQYAVLLVSGRLTGRPSISTDRYYSGKGTGTLTWMAGGRTSSLTVGSTERRCLNGSTSKIGTSTASSAKKRGCFLNLNRKLCMDCKLQSPVCSFNMRCVSTQASGLGDSRDSIVIVRGRRENECEGLKALKALWESACGGGRGTFTQTTLDYFAGNTTCRGCL